MSLVFSLKVVRQRGIPAKLFAADGTFVRTEGSVCRRCVLLELVAAGELLVALVAVESLSPVQDVLVRCRQLQSLEGLSAHATTVTHSFVVLLK